VAHFTSHHWRRPCTRQHPLPRSGRNPPRPAHACTRCGPPADRSLAGTSVCGGIRGSGGSIHSAGYSRNS